MNPTKRPTLLVNGRFPWRWLLLAVLLVRLPAFAVDDTYYNSGYFFSGSGAPVINATNFVNEFGATFDIEYTNNPGGGWLAGLYQNWYYTRNFTNYGEMDCNRGFRFDRQIGSLHTPATAFFNEGVINCGLSNNFFANPSVPTGAYVNATNIVISGTIAAGQNSLIQLGGRYLDLTRGTLRMVNPDGFGISAAPSVTIDPSFSWFPFGQLTRTNASSPFPPGLILTNSLAYIDTQGAGTSNVVVRMVFIQNQNTNVGYNIYIDRPGGILGNGSAHIEWFGTYFDTVNQLVASNYLYLTDFYAGVASTNIFIIPASGIPNNYTFFTTNAPVGLTNPLASGFPPGFGFPASTVTELLTNSYFSGQLTSSAVPTNSAANGALTNLAGRVELTATNDLTLSLTIISGMNYLLLKSTNQFHNDGQSSILSPYTDMYLGATNGNMVISNLLVSSFQSWSGTIQADTTVWNYTDANTGVTTNFRVLVVNANFFPTNGPYVQDCVLNASNNLIISDSLPVYRTLSLNCTNLVISTNTFAAGGAYSPNGGLFLGSPNMFWAACTPRLRNLTNEGLIFTTQLAIYGSNATPYLNFVNRGYITNANGSFITANNFENSGVFRAGGGTFSVRSFTTTMTNGLITANGAFTNISTSFVASNTVILVGKGLTLMVTNLLTDGSTSNNFWSLGTANLGSGISPGLSLFPKPAAGDLLGTTITNICVNGTEVVDTWAGLDRGYSNTGFSNNAALGQLICDARGLPPHTVFYFGGTGVSNGSNAMYVDNLVLAGSATNLDGDNNVKSFLFSNNIVIYYAQATINGVSQAEKLNHKNGDHLRWVPTYAGIFSSTIIINPDGTTNIVNAALAASTVIDSDGDGIPNATDPTPFFLASNIGLNATITNLPPKKVRVQWMTVPNGTNYIFYKTNLLSPAWLPFTNFSHFYWGANVAVSNSAHTNCFASPQPYPSPATNVWVFDVVTNTPHFYRVVVEPWLTFGSPPFP